MKIAYFHYLYGDGTPLNHVRQFASATRELGHEVEIHSMNPAPLGTAPSMTALARRSLKKRLSRYLHEPKELLANLPYIKRELDVLRSTRPDVALVRAHTLTVAEAMVRRVSGIPLVLEVNAPACESTTYWDDYVHVPHAAHLIERAKLGRADRITTVSAALRDHLVATHGIDASRFVVNHNGADCERFHPDLDVSAVRAKYAPNDEALIGFVGSFHPWHGIDLLQAVISGLASARARFVTIGGGDRSAGFRSWLDANGHAERVSMLGSIDHEQIPVHVGAFDIALIAGANFYVSPLKLFEYMAAGRAIVAPADPPIVEVLNDEEDALLFPPGDAGSAADCIRRLIDDRELRTRLGSNARRKAVAEYTWRHNAERVLAACSAAIAQARASRPPL